MSLATRCPACGTVFRVVRDQLKVSEGWVRCGRCSEVFNAGERLFELEPANAPAPTPGPPIPRAAAGSAAIARVGAALAPPSGTSSQPQVETAGPAPQGQPAAPATAPMAEASSDLEADGAPSAPAPLPAAEAAITAAPLQDAPPLPSAAPDRLAPVPAEAAALAGAADAAGAAGAAAAEGVCAVDAAAPAGSSTAALPAEALPPPEAAELDLRADPTTVQTQPTPGFVLRAERAARRRHPLRRGGLALLCLLLAATLAAQLTLHYRDDVAVRWPLSKPWLQGACQWLGCRVEPPRHIDSVAVDSSGLVRVEGSDLYRLTLVVQNRSALPVRMPAIDLALTDAQGRTMVRRVLSAAELGQAVDSLPAQGEVALQAMLELGEHRVAGYTVELFYP